MGWIACMKHAMKVFRQVIATDRDWCHGMRDGVAFVYRHGVRNSLANIYDCAGSAASGVETQNC